MRKLSLAVAVALITSLLPTALTAQGKGFFQISNFDIAGAKLGMNQNQIAVALKAQGYKLTRAIEAGRTWNDEVSRRLALAGRGESKRESASILSEQFYDKGPSTVIVYYAALPNGGLVASQIQYKIAPNVIDPQAFIDQAAKKYGEASHGTSYNRIYCSIGEKQCSANYILTKATLPHLLVKSADTALVLLVGTKAEAEREVAIKQDMDLRAPPAKVAF